MGGASQDELCGLAVDPVGNAYITGWTASSQATFPVRVGPGLTLNGRLNAFVARVNADGKGLGYCGYIGGYGVDQGQAIAVDRHGCAYVVGSASSTERAPSPNLTPFPVTVGPGLRHAGGTDTFVAKVSPSGSTLVYCGYIGGSWQDTLWGLAADTIGNVVVVGDLISPSPMTFPVRVGPDLTFNGVVDAFVAKVSYTNLAGTGAGRVGATLQWDLTATDYPGIRFQLGSSLGTGPIKIDTRTINLSADNLLAVSVAGLWPMVFSGYQGAIDGNGQAKAAIHIPNIPGLIGTRIHTAFVTLDPQAPSGIRSISNTVSFTISK